MGGYTTRFVFLTKTRWEEPPRIRHQLARLLADAGHEVLFFEKPVPVWRRLSAPRAGAHGITVAQHHELLHAKLRHAPVVHRLNAAVVTHSLRRELCTAGVGVDAVVVNFNFDYWFLRTVFPNQPIITMINDDFVSWALFGYAAPLRWALGRTCQASDRVLTVSRPLQRELAEFCCAELFPPWADRPYAYPDNAGARDVLLFWGFINRRLDFALFDSVLRDLAAARPHFRVMVVGPVEQGADLPLAALRNHGNLEILPATALDRLPLARVLAALIPYRRGSSDAAELPNKALQLIARGLPLVISGMPNFVDEPFVFRLDRVPVGQLVDELEARFDSLQPAMQRFVASNSARARLAQFQEGLEPLLDRALGEAGLDPR